MSKLEIDLGPEGTNEQIIQAPIIIQPSDEGYDVKKLSDQYMLFFNYGTAGGTFVLRSDATSVMVLNDGGDDQAIPEDLIGLVNDIEKKGAIGGNDVANFLWAHHNVQNQEFLERVRMGVVDREHPLEYAAPANFLWAYLKSNGDRYSWRDEFWEPVGESIEIATYFPDW